MRAIGGECQLLFRAGHLCPAIRRQAEPAGTVASVADQLAALVATL